MHFVRLNFQRKVHNPRDYIIVMRAARAWPRLHILTEITEKKVKKKITTVLVSSIYLETKVGDSTVHDLSPKLCPKWYNSIKNWFK